MVGTYKIIAGSNRDDAYGYLCGGYILLVKNAIDYFMKRAVASYDQKVAETFPYGFQCQGYGMVFMPCEGTCKVDSVVGKML